jgi:hypothetical protein
MCAIRRLSLPVGQLALQEIISEIEQEPQPLAAELAACQRRSIGGGVMI